MKEIVELKTNLEIFRRFMDKKMKHGDLSAEEEDLLEAVRSMFALLFPTP